MVFQSHRFRRTSGRCRTDLWGLRWSGRVLRRIDELEFHHGWIGFDQWDALRNSNLAGSRLAQRGMDRT